ncbi:unnamed protein product [marine sediment metagenome]|uniref:HTH cro/C1-type domain-containing protein n=1 Tax=marine sediment metagenome TaxID=412755 RepID=X1KW54_9ZZZZ
MSNDSKALGQRIKGLRLKAGLTLRQLGVESSVSASHLGGIERGERLPSARILRKIAKPFGFDQSELLSFVDFLLAQPCPDA